MSVTRVTPSSLSASSNAATAYSLTVPTGTGIQAGDLVTVVADGNFSGTRVSKGMKVKDSVNGTNYTTIDETQQGGSSSHWMQTFCFQTPKAIPDGSSITFTPSSGSTVNSFAVDVWRGTTGAITRAVQKLTNAASLTPAAPALASAPAAGDLVLTFCGASSGTLGAGSPFTLGSANQGAGGVQSVGIGYVLSASGSSTYASTWTDSSSQTSATQTVAFGSVAGAPALAVTTTSPLPGGQVGVPYSDTLTAQNGVAPLTWSRQSGSLPAGLNLLLGSGGGSSSAPVTYIGADTGPQGAPTEAAFAAAQTPLGPLGCYKTFFSGSGLYGGALPSSWSGSLADQITSAFPGVFVYISWGQLMTQTQINSFVDSIPDTDANGNQMVVGFSYQSEPEAAYPATAAGGQQFVNDWTDQALKIRNAAKLTGARLILVTSHYMPPYASGTAGVSAIRDNGVFIPPPTNGGGVVLVDYYGADFYQHEQSAWAPTDMSHDSRWINWTALTAKQGPLALTEYGISYDNTQVTDAQGQATRNQRIQADWAYLQSAFGPGGSVRNDPMLCWLYWENGVSGGASTKYLFTDAATEATWRGIVNSAGVVPGQPISSGGSGGTVSGTPSAAGTSTFVAKVTDATGATALSPSLSLTIAAASTLAITTTGVPGGTLGTAFLASLFASGGALPYTWTNLSAMPAGLSLAADGTISGTPTAAATTSVQFKVTDNLGATATATLSITISAPLTVSTTQLPGASAGVAFQATVQATGGTFPYTYAILSGALPAGLVLDSGTGIISGTPTGGSSGFAVGVTDAAGSTVTVQLAISVAGVSGGGIVGRRRYGATAADYVLSQGAGGSVVFDAGAAIQFWTDLAGGTQYDNLTDKSGNPITTVTADSHGLPPEFYGPADVWKMAADAFGGAGPRVWMLASDMGDLLTALTSQLSGLVPKTGSAGTVTLNGTTPVTVFSPAVTSQ